MTGMVLLLPGTWGCGLTIPAVKQDKTSKVYPSILPIFETDLCERASTRTEKDIAARTGLPKHEKKK